METEDLINKYLEKYSVTFSNQGGDEQHTEIVETVGGRKSAIEMAKRQAEGKFFFSQHGYYVECKKIKGRI